MSSTAFLVAMFAPGRTLFRVALLLDWILRFGNLLLSWILLVTWILMLGSLWILSLLWVLEFLGTYKIENLQEVVGNWLFNYGYSGRYWGTWVYAWVVVYEGSCYFLGCLANGHNHIIIQHQVKLWQDQKSELGNFSDISRKHGTITEESQVQSHFKWYIIKNDFHLHPNWTNDLLTIKIELVCNFLCYV